MQPVSNDSFGPLIAYLAPGATVLLGLSHFSELLRNWFATTPADVPTIGGFLYLTVSSIAAGMTVSAIRWATIDRIHARTGVPTPAFDFRRLGENVTAFTLLIEIHYRHYLFYANMFVATGIAYACYRVSIGTMWPVGWIDVGVLLLEIVFFTTSRDTLAKYYSRGQQLLTNLPAHPTTTSAVAEPSQENPQNQAA